MTCGSPSEEEAALVARAEREKVTVPNLLITAALSEAFGDADGAQCGDGGTDGPAHICWRGSSNNINQIARQANAGDEFPQEATRSAGVYA